MADISDITSYLVTAATTAVYPNGTSVASVANMDVRLFEGWPMPDQLDLDVGGFELVGGVKVARARGPLASVSVYPMAGTNVIPYQILDQTYVITPPSYGLTFGIASGVITLTGTPQPGEYISIIADNQYAFSATGVSAASIISQLAAYFVGFYPATTFTSSTLTVTYTAYLTVRQGAQGTLGKVVHRQRQSVMVTVWAPTHDARTTLSMAIDVYLKSNFKVAMPDTSQALITYNRTNLSDDQQVATIYRRDLIYDAEYATVQQFPGYVVTITETTIASAAQPTVSVVAFE